MKILWIIFAFFVVSGFLKTQRTSSRPIVGVDTSTNQAVPILALEPVDGSVQTQRSAGSNTGIDHSGDVTQLPSGINTLDMSLADMALMGA